MSDAFVRLNAMIDPNQQTWDLSPNDVASIREVLATCKRQGNKLNAIREYCMRFPIDDRANNVVLGFMVACKEIKSIIESEVQL